MRKIRTKLQAVILVVAVTVGAVFGNGSFSAKAADSSEKQKLKIQVTYGQTEARRMLDMINEFRQGEDAWAWNQGNTEKVTYPDLGTLQTDPVLEKTAMIRAVEIALYYSHTRPNGERCFTAYRDDVAGANAENIAVGYRTTEAVFEGWQEADDDYDGQGHRRNMLGSNYVSVGIGHVTYQGIHCWVQEFSNKTSGEDLAEPDDSTNIEELDVLSSNIQKIELSQTSYSLQTGETISLDDLKVSAEIAEHWPSSAKCGLENDCSFTVADEQIASVQDNRLSAKSTGTTTMTASVLGKEIPIEITVIESTTAPTQSPNPVTSGEPEKTENPSASNQPNITENPINSNQPDITKNPTTSSQPSTTENPTTSSQPSTTENPSTSSQPNTTKTPTLDDSTINSDSPNRNEGSEQLENPLKGKKVTGIKVKQKKKSRKATIRFKRMKKADGYRITYAQNKKFTKNRKVKNTKSVSLTLSGLKHKKTYYFKVCAYTVNQNGKKQYGTESKVVKCKIK